MSKMILSKKYKGVYTRKRKDGDITIYFTYKDIGGKLFYHKLGLKSQGVTEQYAHEKRSETVLKLMNGEIPTIIVNKNKRYKITLDEIADFYFTNHITISLKKRQRQYINRIKPLLGSRNIYNITSKDIISLQDTLEKENLSNQTIILYTELLSTIFNFYTKHTSTTLINPTISVRKPSVNNRRERVLSKTEIISVFNEIENDFTLTLFFALGLTTAARKGTILNYKIKDVNLEEKTINSYDFKNRTSYKSFLDERTINLIKTRIIQSRNEPNALLVFKYDIKDINRWISREFKIVFDNLFNLGLEINDRRNRVVIHSIRHTVLSHLGRNGSNIFLLQKISNHKSLSLVSHYTKLEDDTGKNEMQNLWE